MSQVLIYTIFIPIAAAITMMGSRQWARWWALAATLASLVGAIVLVCNFPVGADKQGVAENFAATNCSWLGTPDSVAPAPPVRPDAHFLNVRFNVALDGLSLWMFALTALLMVVAVLVSWEAITDQAPLYYRLLLLLGTGMLGVFVARDIILFYLFFEFTLVPLVFLIGIWGSDQRRYAAVKFFLFTLAGSVLTLLGLLAIVLHVAYAGAGGLMAAISSPSAAGAHAMTFNIPELTAQLAAHPMPRVMQIWIFLALFAGFAIKVPLFPLHTWLPLAHTEAPAAGSILLAGVLLKIGTYGFVRFCLPMLPEGTAVCVPWMLWLSVTGIIYGALVALAQSDLKRLIAYSSVSHLGFCMLGIFALNHVAVQGGVLQMVNHGLSTGGLFALVGMLYERYHTRRIADYGGIAVEVPILAAFMVFMTLASIGLPGLNGFAGEFLLLLGMFQRAFAGPEGVWTMHYRVIAVLATSGVVLGAWYMLSLIRRVFFGPLVHREHQHAVHDLTWREITALVPLCAMIVWIGVQPGFFLDRMAPALDKLSSAAAEKLERENRLRDMETSDKKPETASRLPSPKAKQSPALTQNPAPTQTSAELARVP